MKPNLVASLGLVVLLACTVAACEHALVVPSAAQVVSATVTRTAVRIAPATVHAGTVYLRTQSDGPELVFIAASESAERHGPLGLTDGHLDAILHGDLFHTYQASGFRSGGELGNATELGELSPGKYLFLPAGVVTLAPGAYDAIPSGAFAVLEVVP